MSDHGVTRRRTRSSHTDAQPFDSIAREEIDIAGITQNTVGPSEEAPNRRIDFEPFASENSQQQQAASAVMESTTVVKAKRNTVRFSKRCPICDLNLTQVI